MTLLSWISRTAVVMMAIREQHSRTEHPPTDDPGEVDAGSNLTEAN
jgi:hypothetical protein